MFDVQLLENTFFSLFMHPNSAIKVAYSIVIKYVTDLRVFRVECEVPTRIKRMVQIYHLQWTGSNKSGLIISKVVMHGKGIFGLLKGRNILLFIFSVI